MRHILFKLLEFSLSLVFPLDKALVCHNGRLLFLIYSKFHTLQYSKYWLSHRAQAMVIETSLNSFIKLIHQVPLLILIFCHSRVMVLFKSLRICFQMFPGNLVHFLQLVLKSYGIFVLYLTFIQIGDRVLHPYPYIFFSA